MTIRSPSNRGVSLGGFGAGPIPRDLLILLAVLFVTFSLQFFETTRLVPALLRLTPLVWQRGFVWQLATYPFIGYGGASLWILLELYILYMFGSDAYRGLGRRHFWRLVMTAALAAALVAVAVDALAAATGGRNDLALPFSLMQGQRVLMAILIAAFATANGRATIMLFFILPIEARWFLAIEILFAFIGFLQTHDLAGFLGICTAVGVAYAYVRSGGGGRRGLREMRLRMERWWIQHRLGRLKKKRGLRVIPGEKRGPWVH